MRAVCAARSGDALGRGRRSRELPGRCASCGGEWLEDGEIITHVRLEREILVKAESSADAVKD